MDVEHSNPLGRLCPLHLVEEMVDPPTISWENIVTPEIDS
jgi:hypothetical protein